jgi:nucleotide-binding universal stress UspA family protein
LTDPIYKKVVVPLDGSPLAETALPYAEEIAGQTGAEIVLLSVLSSEEPEDYRNHYTYLKTVIDATTQQVKKYTRNHGGQECVVSNATRVGNPTEGILEYINKGLCMVVMATHGRSGVSRWAIGSVADKVVRSTTKQPLLLIRTNKDSPEVRRRHIFKKALLPLDGSTESEAVMPVITEIATQLQMELILLGVTSKKDKATTEAESYHREWSDRLGKNNISSRVEFRTGAPADHIIDLADEAGCDMVAMCTHSRSIWPLGSVAQKVLLGGNKPLLLVRA